MRYARDTEVAPEQSRIEIERTLTAYGAKQFGYMVDEKKASVLFVFNKLPVRLDLPMPNPESKAIVKDGRGRKRTDRQRESAIEKQSRQAWRVLLLLVKAKLEAVEAGITTVEKEFFADVVLPGGRRLFDELVPRLPQIAAGDFGALQLEGPKQ